MYIVTMCITQVEWVCTDDRGPNGATGRAVFDPPIAASLIVTLYKVWLLIQLLLVDVIVTVTSGVWSNRQYDTMY